MAAPEGVVLSGVISFTSNVMVFLSTFEYAADVMSRQHFQEKIIGRISVKNSYRRDCLSIFQLQVYLTQGTGREVSVNVKDGSPLNMCRKSGSDIKVSTVCLPCK